MAYWALKTWENDDEGYSEDKDKWKYFLREQVIAIGWRDFDISLNNKMGRKEIREALKRKDHYSDRKAIPPASIIYNFIQLVKDDSILICQGYIKKQTAKVHLYGTAEKILDFRIDPNPRWEWELKHKATVIEFPENKREIEKEKLSRMLSKGFLNRRPHGGSLRLTLQKITKEGYESVVEWVKH